MQSDLDLAIEIVQGMIELDDRFMKEVPSRLKLNRLLLSHLQTAKKTYEGDND